MRSPIVLCLGAAALFSSVYAAGPGNPLPVFFFENNGRLVARTPEIAASFSAGGVDLRLHGADLRMTFEGANAEALVSAERPLAARANFLTGDDPERWRVNVELFQTVRYRGLYPGIDMTYGGTGRRLKSEFIVAPVANPRLVRMSYSGFKEMFIDGDGRLVFRFESGELRDDAPEVHQLRGGRQVSVPCRYELHGNGSVGFALGPYDPSLELIIDPVLSYSTYLGGSGFDAITGIAVDSSGNAYVAGYTDSLDFPIAGAIQGGTGGGVDAFVAKLNPAGNALLYATYIGGSGDDRARGLALDASGNVIITGSTTSSNFPRVAAYQTALSGGRDAFITKLNSVGNVLVFSTYFGGAGYDSGNAIAADSSGSVYIAGDTYSTNLPVLGPMQSVNAGRQDGFAAKFSAAGALQYSTYLGGAGDDRALAIAVDTAGAAYITGNTTSANFPVANAFQPANAGGQDAFVTKLNAAGNAIVYSTYLGGSGGIAGYPESGNGIAVDAALSAYVTGVTHSANFPKQGALQTGHAGGGLDAFVSKFTPAGSALVYSTFLGGIGLDTATAIAVDAGGIAYVTGNTTSPDFPTVSPIQSVKSGSIDAFVVAVDSAGASLLFSTFFGGNSGDGGTAIALNSSGKVWIAGQTTSTDFPVLGPIQATGYSEGNGFAASIAQVVIQKAVMSTPAPGSVLSGASVTFTWNNTGATAYALDVGTTVGGTNITTGSVGAATSKTVSGIPVNGSTIYVRLSTSISGVWQFFDYTYTAA
ncbi:MAG: SBBP repeat-containing protein, partial [Bryobacteraceae bacterium]